MYNWEEGPYVDELYIWEQELEDEYEMFLKENCRCVDDCECMSLNQFKDKALDDIADRCSIEYDEEMYG